MVLKLIHPSEVISNSKVNVSSFPKMLSVLIFLSILTKLKTHALTICIIQSLGPTNSFS